MTTAYNIWAFGTQGERHAYIKEQDGRFQAALRAELVAIAADRGLRLVPKVEAPRVIHVAPMVRDMIVIAHTVPSEMPMTDAQRIMKEICAKHKITKAELIGRQRSRPIAAARHEAAYRMKRETTLSLPQIGRRLGGRDHTTIIMGIRSHLKRMEAVG